MSMSNHAQWRALRNASTDQSIKDQKLKAGTFKRIVSFATPYKTQLVIFLLMVVLDALLTVSVPLILKQLIDKGVVPHNGKVVTQLALLVAVFALFDAGINLVLRWHSSQIGEGLIYDLRTQVFGHVQKQSIAFFTRTQTGALISRLNSDVIGAQQAFTDH